MVFVACKPGAARREGRLLGKQRSFTGSEGVMAGGTGDAHRYEQGSSSHAASQSVFRPCSRGSEQDTVFPAQVHLPAMALQLLGGRRTPQLGEAPAPLSPSPCDKTDPVTDYILARRAVRSGFVWTVLGSLRGSL